MSGGQSSIFPTPRSPTAPRNTISRPEFFGYSDNSNFGSQGLYGRSRA